MSLAPWRSFLARSLHKHKSEPQSRYFQIATVDKQGYPTNRTVVFRGFREKDDQIKFITDRRSEKVLHLDRQPRAEICWYFAKTREQFRIAGPLMVIDAAYPDQELLQARQATWQQISDAARSQFLWPAPGQPVTKSPVPDASGSPDKMEPGANFCLVIMAPQRVDHLQLAGQQHRTIYERDRQGNWSQQQVNP
ncbi:pyridoxamine 5'-phosphate oxidase-related FMN-binding protein [Thalassoporum mexicanum PCC 7367]|uniref:Npun_F5749 family FMN-dependent PPOX-type flavoprotein n=1 Tax=Thalassoporum mexicanum TaxID=3457544 RepID=UPI0002A000AC|nr:Npun_F5749 family FMN-dependent PPOX-type flavoprotein [Pseudanabaena sp. PCC 7367]AFY68783.1 pyridoxamine 5'-phosphate oxidase-related FMN-binding protein [Pseudanabaena sp. PCC 7367]